MKKKWSIENVIKHFGKELRTEDCGIDAECKIYKNTEKLLQVKVNNSEIRDDLKEFVCFYSTYKNEHKNIVEGFAIQEYFDAINTIILNDLGLDMWGEKEVNIKLIELTFNGGILIIDVVNNTFIWNKKEIK